MINFVCVFSLYVSQNYIINKVPLIVIVTVGYQVFFIRGSPFIIAFHSKFVILGKKSKTSLALNAFVCTESRKLKNDFEYTHGFALYSASQMFY